MPKKILSKKKIVIKELKKKNDLDGESINEDNEDEDDDDEDDDDNEDNDNNEDDVDNEDDDDNEDNNDNEDNEDNEENEENEEDFDNEYNDDNESVCNIQNLIEENNNDDNFNEDKYDDILEYVTKEERQSGNRLTKYEMVRIIGERIKQLTMGAKPLIKNHKDLSYDRIAIEELKLNMTPFKIRRPLPNGKYELYSLDELKKDHLLVLLDEI